VSTRGPWRRRPESYARRFAAGAEGSPRSRRVVRTGKKNALTVYSSADGPPGAPCGRAMERTRPGTRDRWPAFRTRFPAPPTFSGTAVVRRPASDSDGPVPSLQPRRGPGCLPARTISARQRLPAMWESASGVTVRIMAHKRRYGGAIKRSFRPRLAYEQKLQPARPLGGAVNSRQAEGPVPPGLRVARATRRSACTTHEGVRATEQVWALPSNAVHGTLQSREDAGASKILWATTTHPWWGRGRDRGAEIVGSGLPV